MLIADVLVPTLWFPFCSGLDTSIPPSTPSSTWWLIGTSKMLLPTFCARSFAGVAHPHAQAGSQASWLTANTYTKTGGPTGEASVGLVNSHFFLSAFCWHLLKQRLFKVFCKPPFICSLRFNKCEREGIQIQENKLVTRPVRQQPLGQRISEYWPRLASFLAPPTGQDTG